MRKTIYIILFVTMFVGVVGFWEVQQLKSEEFKEGISFFVDRILKQDSYSMANEIYKRNEKRKANILEITFAINSYRKDYNNYPNKPEISGSLTESGIFSEDSFVNPIYPEYIDIPIKDPVNNSDHHYTYMCKNNNFVIFARLEGGEVDIAEKNYYCIDNVSRSPMIVHSNPSINMRCQ
jgi:hypothetical protein